MRRGQSILCVVPTKSGPVSITVNIVCDGPDDGTAAVLTDLAAHVARAGRFAANAVTSPPVTLPEYETWALGMMADDGCTMKDSRE